MSGSTPPRDIVVVGASLAGLRAAEAIRMSGYTGRLSIVGEEQHEPYDRTPLSKQVALGMVEADQTALPRRCMVDAAWHLGVAAVSVAPEERVVTLADRRRLPFDRLLVATGARARPWPRDNEAVLEGVLTLRTREDGARLRRALYERPSRVVVVGGGFNGSEVASACRDLGIPVTLVEHHETPLASALGCVIGRTAAALQREHGVDLRCGASVTHLEGSRTGHVCRVHLSEELVPIDADLVVIALGTIANIDWLAGSGLAADGEGLACDDRCRALDQASRVADDVFCAGDVARFPHALFGGASRRVEHWSNAVEQGSIAGGNMLASPDTMRAHDGVPTFWSSQFDTSIKAVGVPSAGTEVSIVQGSLESGRFVALYGRQGRLVAAVTFDHGKWLQRYVPLIAAGAPFPCPGGMDAPPEMPPMPSAFPARRAAGAGNILPRTFGNLEAADRSTFMLEETRP